MNFEDINTLGNIVDPTYKDAYDGIGSFKVLPKIVSEDRMEITCMVIVNLLNRSEMQKASSDAKASLDKACNACLKEIKKEFKTASGRALKTKKLGEPDASVELINMSAYSPKGTALVRCVYSFEIG
tara:strand:- start:892 stop:1272 length:381 start_codon:yes stop_codon:yes gene_type:complete